MEKLLLSEIAHCLNAECPEEKVITEISTDTRNLPAGCLFIAIKGERFDGHAFIKQAIENGARQLCLNILLTAVPVLL